MLKPTKEQKELCRLVTPEMRFSYPHVQTAHAPKGGDKKKFSVTGLFEKTSDLSGTSPDGKPRTLQQVIKQAKINAFGPDKAKWPKNIVSPVQDGDDPKFSDKEGYKGHWVISFKSNEDQRPSVVDRDMTPITDQSVVYPGCYGRVYSQAYVNEYMGTIRVLFSLDHVQKLRNGKSFGGKKPVEQVFSPVTDITEDEVESAIEDEEEVDFK